MASDNSNQMDQASRTSRLLNNGKFKSERQATRITGVKRSTLRNQRTGAQPQQQQVQLHTRLLPEQKKVLIQYIKDAQLQYVPINNT